MAQDQGGTYWMATRHPWSCVVFVLPLLIAYEVGLYGLGAPAPELARNGADVWLRAALAAVGVPPLWGAPCLLLGVLLGWSFVRRQDRPTDQLGIWAGMAAESALFALLLLCLSQALWQLLLLLDPLLPRDAALSVGAAPRTPDPALEQVVAYLGAGLYEETLFRLLLYSGLLALFTLAEFPTLLAVILAATGSALAFAAAHHLGAGGETFDGRVFAFRAAAGLCFAWLFHVRGFGVSVGAHTGYDVLVGLLLR